MQQDEMIVVQIAGTNRKFLAHEGHAHRWSNHISDAMLYTKKDVAVGLCIANKGTAVVDIKTHETLYQA